MKKKTKTILQLNATYGIGSTGKIVKDLDDFLINKGQNSYVICAYSNVLKKDNVFITSKLSNWISIRFNLLLSRITGKMGYNQKITTKKIIKKIDVINPDVIQLHNIHGNWINIFDLFEYLKNKDIKIIWTLHDCWAFTGRCSHFELIECKKWMTGCYDCNNKKVYPTTYFFDFSNRMWLDKKQLFLSLHNITIVAPSKWLTKYVSKSFFKNNNIVTINNGININIFSPQDLKSSLFNTVNNKKIILGVANSWSESKGLKDFIQIDKMIDHNLFQVVLVGVNKKIARKLSPSIISLNLINDQNELARIYSSADVFVNPTYQDNYPTTNLEALACGTPVITYRTGGSPESTFKKEWVIEKGNVVELYKCILNVLNEKIDRNELREFALNNFDKNIKYDEYYRLYLE